MVCKRLLLVSVAACALASLPAAVYANVYASGLKAVGDDGLSFILNENADTNVKIEVLADGVPVYAEDLGPKAAGTHTWSWSGAGFVTGANHTVKITASDDGYAGWTQIVADNTTTSFYIPVGVSINKNRNSPNFGKIYISEVAGGATAFRTTTSGIYMLNADGSDAGFATGGKDWAAAGNSSPFKSTIGADDHLYVMDYSNDLAWEFSADMSSVTQLIDGSNKTSAQWAEGIHVEGTQAQGNRKIYLVNSNYNDTARKGLIEYNLGGNAAATAGDTGTQIIGPSYFGYYPRDVARDSNGDWYMNQFRSELDEAPPVSKFADGPPPINTAVWEANKALYRGAYGIDIFEDKNWVAYGDYYAGLVQIFDMTTGAYVGGFDAGNRLREIAFDAAGNLVTVDNSLELARIWSPGDGGNWYATESYFTIIPEPATLVLLTLGGFLLRRRVR